MTTTRCPLAFPLVLFALPASSLALGDPSEPPIEIDAIAENRDGTVLDVATLPDDSIDPTGSRAWLAQGRVRAAIDVATRARIFAEDATFDGQVPGHPEMVLAVEVVAGTPNYLYTMTDQRLYREEFIVPDVTANRVSWAVPRGVSPQDFKVADDRIFLLGPNGLYIYDQTVTPPQAPLAVKPMTCSGTFVDDGLPSTEFNALGVNSFGRLRLALDDDGGRFAYATAQMSGYQVLRPRPELVMACNLDSANGYANPTWYRTCDGVKSAVFWNPMRDSCDPCDNGMTPPPCDIELDRWVGNPAQGSIEAARYSIHGIDATDQGRLYAACGVKNQVQVLDTSDPWGDCIDPGGIHFVEKICVDGSETQTFSRVLADPAAPLGRIFVASGGAFFVAWDQVVSQATACCDPDPSTWVSATIAEGTGAGAERDLAYTLLTGSATPTVWTTGTAEVDHVCKVFDVTTNTPMLAEQYFGLYASDGGVAVPEWSSVYLPTFAGVVRYRDVACPGCPPVWEAVPGSFQPAEDPMATCWGTPCNPGTGPGNPLSNTEHIALAEVAGVHRLFTISGNGDFTEFQLDPATSDPLPGRRFEPDPTKLPSSTSWDCYDPRCSFDGFYANDIAHVRIPVLSEIPPYRDFVLTNLGNSDPDSDQACLLAYEYDAATDTWVHCATEQTPPIPGTGGVNTISTLQVMDPSGPPPEGPAAVLKTYAFMGTGRGFAIVDLSGLTGTSPKMRLTEDVTSQAGPMDPTLPYYPTLAPEGNGQYLFTVVNRPASVGGPELWVFEWDPSTGDIVDPSMDLDPLLVKGSEFFLDDPGFAEAFRVRFAPAPLDEGTLFISGRKGTVLRVRHQLDQNMNPSPGYTGRWQSDYQNAIQDTRIYNFGTFTDPVWRMLIVKDREAFAWVDPFQAF